MQACERAAAEAVAAGRLQATKGELQTVTVNSHRKCMQELRGLSCALQEMGNTNVEQMHGIAARAVVACELVAVRQKLPETHKNSHEGRVLVRIGLHTGGGVPARAADSRPPPVRATTRIAGRWQWWSSALTSVPAAWPGEGCTTRPACLLTTSRYSSSYTTSSGIACTAPPHNYLTCAQPIFASVLGGSLRAVMWMQAPPERASIYTSDLRLSKCGHASGAASRGGSGGSVHMTTSPARTAYDVFGCGFPLTQTWPSRMAACRQNPAKLGCSPTHCARSVCISVCAYLYTGFLCSLTCSLARLACGILPARNASSLCFAGASAAATLKLSAASCERVYF